MKQISKTFLLVIVGSILFVSVSTNLASAETIPEWVKNNALWYGQGIVSESEFLTAIKFLIENDIIVIESNKIESIQDSRIVIPNGNFDVSATSFYIPLNLEIPAGATVIWTNDDSVPHNIQSQDEFGSVIDLFNSPPMNTGDTFTYTFEEEGVYNYFCSFHPWRIGLVTVK